MIKKISTYADPQNECQRMLNKNVKVMPVIKMYNMHPWKELEETPQQKTRTA